MPLNALPADWPIFTPKDQMVDWLEAYVDELGLNIWTNTELSGATFDEPHWTQLLSKMANTLR